MILYPDRLARGIQIDGRPGHSRASRFAQQPAAKPAEPEHTVLALWYSNGVTSKLPSPPLHVGDPRGLEAGAAALAHPVTKTR